MVAPSAAAIASAEQLRSANFADTPITAASIASYLKSGERTRELMDLAFKGNAAVLVLIALAWTLGILPGAVKLF